MLRSLLVAGCVLIIGCASAPKPSPPRETEAASSAGRPASPTRTEFLTPAEIMKRMEDSTVQYRLEPKDSPPGGWAEALWPRRFEPVPEPRVVVGMLIQGDVLVPRGFAHEEGKDVIAEFDPDYGAAWLAYANCKALWLGEPSHREEMTGTAERHFSSTEELECLASVANIHAAKREEGEEVRMDASLDRLLAVISDGMAPEMVLFEMAARVHPQDTLTLDDESRQRSITWLPGRAGGRWIP